MQTTISKYSAALAPTTEMSLNFSYIVCLSYLGEKKTKKFLLDHITSIIYLFAQKVCSPYLSLSAFEGEPGEELSFRSKQH